MSYLSINIDNLSNMISEYNNLIEALKGCGDILSQSIGSLYEFEFSGVDAEILRKAWGAETYDKIPTIREVLESVKSALEDSLEEYKNCKKYNEEFIVAFDGYGDVCFSAEDMSGNVKCDTSMLADSSSYCAEIGDIKLDIATSIVSAKNMMAGLNKTAISQEIEDFSNLNSKLNQFSLHQFSLSKYSTMMTEADDNLYNKLNAKNFSFTSLYINDGYVPPAVKLMNYSPEAIKCALIISKPVENRTEKEIEFFDSHCNFNSVDYALLMGAIGGAGEDIEWDDLQVKFMANGFLYGLENDDKDLMTLFYSYALVETPSSIYFGNDKLGKVLGSLDDTTNPLAYFTLARDLNMHVDVDKHSMNTEISVIDENGNYVFVLSQYGFDNYGNKDYYRVEKIPFINMYDKISEEGLYNIRNELHMNHDEEVAFLSSFYSDEDLEHLCELACISKGDTEALEKFFESSTKGVTPAFYTALADYTYHLGEYGTEEYAEQLGIISNSLLSVGHTRQYMGDLCIVGPDNTSFYFSALSNGYKVRFDEANIMTAMDYNDSDMDKFAQYGALCTLYKSEEYMYQNGLNSTTILGTIKMDGIASDNTGVSDNHDFSLITNQSFKGYTFGENNKINYSLYFETKGNKIEPNSIYEYNVTVYGEYDNAAFNNYNIVNNMNNIQWRETTFPYRAAYAIGSEALGYTPIDEVCPIVSKGGDVLSSIRVVKGLYDEYKSFDEDMMQEYNNYFCDKTGWRTGFIIGSLDNEDVPLGNFSFDKKESAFVVISEPYSPLGYIISEEINNGLLVEDFTDYDKQCLIDGINASTNDTEKREVMKSILFGGFDREEYLENHSVVDYTLLYTKAIEVYDEKLNDVKGTTLFSYYQVKINERYEELCYN